MAAETEPEAMTEPEQLTLDDEFQDDVDFGAWVESLPIELEAA